MFGKRLFEARRFVLAAGVVALLLSVWAGVSLAGGAPSVGADSGQQHLPGLLAHNVGPDGYGTHSSSGGPADGGVPSKVSGQDLALRAGSVAPLRQGFPALGAEIPKFRTEFSNTYATAAGGFVARTFSVPVNFRAPDGSFQAINNAVIPAASGGFSNRADSARVLLPGTLRGHTVVTAAGGSVSARLLGAAGSAPRVSGSVAAYGRVLPGVSVSYRASHGLLKESVVLANVAAGGSLRFLLGFSRGLRPRLVAGGSLKVLDARGRTRFVLPAPFMSDASASKRSRPGVVGAVGVRLVHVRAGWVLTLVPDRRWLNAAGRRFPVLLDPTVVYGPSEDAFIEGGVGANSNFYAQSADYVGTVSGVPIRTLLKFPSIVGVAPGDAQILSARVAVDVQSLTGTPSVSAYQMTPNTNVWYGNEVTWNDYNGVYPWGTPGGDFKATPTDTQTVSALGWSYFNVTKVVQAWVDGSLSTNNGIMLKQTNETTSAVIGFPSGRQSSNYPFIDVLYAPRLGSPRGSTVLSTPLNDRSSLGVNVTNGNLLVHNSDLHVPGTGVDQSIDRTYNNLSSSAGGPGNGWTMSGARSPSLGSYGGKDVVYSAPDGGSYAFTYDWGAVPAYQPPPGIDATLCNSYMSGCQPPTGSLWSLTFRDGQVLGFDWGGNLVYQGDKNANHLSSSYNGGGTVNQITDTQGRKTTFGYAANPNLLASVSDAAYPGGRSTGYGQDASGNLTSYADASSNQTLYGYDASRNLTQITDAAGHITKLGYDTSGRVTSLLQVTNQALGTGDTTTYSYNATTPACPNQPPGYPAYGAPALAGTRVTDPRGHVTTYCHDTHDRVYISFDAKSQSRQASYSPDDNTTTSTLPSGDVFTADYDGVDRPCKLSDPSSGGARTAATQSVLYTGQATACDRAPLSGDHPFYPDTSIDAQGHQQQYSYDPAPNSNLNKIQSQLSAQNTLTFTHNTNGTLKTSTDANTNQTAYGYDPQGNPTSLTPPSPLHGDTTSPDALSRTASHTDGNAKTTGYRYDKLDRVLEADYADGSKTTYTYDADGNLTQRADSSTGTSTYTYDNKSRLTQQALPNATTNYGYDGANNLTSLQDSFATVTYSYDETNLLSQAQESTAANPIRFTYDQNSRRTCTSYPNGVYVNYTYDHANLLSTRSTKGSGAACNSTMGTPLSEDSYTYFTTAMPGKDTSLVQSHTEQHGNQSRNTITYQYDPLNRVTSASSTSGDNRQYTYDGAGNITSRTINGTTTIGAFNAANELMSQGSTTYSYDANGNELTSSQGLAFTYNARNQTSSITLPGQQSFSLSYQGSTQDELSQSGSLTIGNNNLGVGSLPQYGWQYTHTNDGALLTEHASSYGNYNYLTDNLGSVVGLTDPNGNLANTYQYDPYGQIITTTGSSGNPFGYAQGLTANTTSLAPTSNLYHYGARYYDATTGRFTQQDPSNQPTDPNQANRYTYAGGNPINQRDPSGLCFVLDCSTYHDIGHAAQKVYNAGAGCLTGAEIGGAAGLAVASPEAGAAAGCVAGAVGGQFTPTQPYTGKGYPRYR